MRIAAALALVGLLTTMGCRTGSAPPVKRIIVLGIDGMDPAFLERHWNDLPNLNRLRSTGDFKRLATTVPPQSPVAWSTFSTGLNPGGHGVFDFVHRNPATLALFSSMAETEPPRRTLSIGPYVIPLSKGRVRQFRKGLTFWQLLDRHNIPVTLLRMPNNFPPVPSKAKSLSGMGTPDLLGTFGTFTMFSSDPEDIDRLVPGGRIVSVPVDNNHAKLVLEGPENSLRKDRRRTSVTISVWRDPQSAVLLVEIDGRRLLLGEHEWSDWIRISLPVVSPIAGLRGMFRIYVKQVRPALKLYITPINIDPSAPELPLSMPEEYSGELADAVGPFYTQGIAEDTAALRSGVLDLHEYKQQSDLVANEQFRILHHALRSFAGGVLFFHFLGVDQNSHVFWGLPEDAVLESYRRVDREIEAVWNDHPDATLIVMSDHGFSEFRRAVNLNTWLMREGFLALDNIGNAGDTQSFADVDWQQTVAYSAGLNGIYINQAGREKRGIVAASEKDALIEKIAQRLEELRDPKDGSVVIAKVYRSSGVYRGDAMEAAPDLVVGWNSGYRSSWQTALGEVSRVTFEDNTDEWRGDHCIAAHLVPGVFLSNRKTSTTDLRLEDITATLLAEFGVSPAPGMEGKPVFSK
jgi:predicted AlkP superfamily phosphohydrolase/phosphomutase